MYIYIYIYTHIYHIILWYIISCYIVLCYITSYYLRDGEEVGDAGEVEEDVQQGNPEDLKEKGSSGRGLV